MNSNGTEERVMMVSQRPVPPGAFQRMTKIDDPKGSGKPQEDIYRFQGRGNCTYANRLRIVLRHGEMDLTRT